MSKFIYLALVPFNASDFSPTNIAVPVCSISRMYESRDNKTEIAIEGGPAPVKHMLVNENIHDLIERINQLK